MTTPASRAVDLSGPHDPLDDPDVRAAVEQGARWLEAQAAQRALVRRRRFDSIAIHGIYGMEAALANGGSIIEPAVMSPAQHFATAAEMEILPSVPEALSRLRSAGFLLIVVTNQPDVATGRQAREDRNFLDRLFGDD